MEKIDAVIIGGGLAGLSCAYKLADAGMQVIVLERGDFPGSKNVTGGRLYLMPVKDLIGDMLDGAPFERKVVSERWSLMGETNSLSLAFSSDRFSKEDHSYTILRARLDRWLSEKLMAKGVFVIPKYRVDDLIFEGDSVSGVRIGTEEIYAHAVVACDGVLSFMARKAGLTAAPAPSRYAVGIKEVIELPPEKINDRFNVDSTQGVAQLFLGDVTKGMFGGGFLYTNRESISLGIVVGIEALMKGKGEAHTLMDAFTMRPEIRPLIEGGTLAEYSAHVIPEAGYHGISKLFTRGMLVAGDAAGFALNMGVTVRGMEFAIASGIIAAETLIEGKGDYSSYEKRLKETFVLKDLMTARNMPRFLENDAFFSYYPRSVPELIERVMWFGAEPKETFFKTIRASRFLSLKRLKDLIRIRDI
jgi:electron transfer flavoprotein-quinone oxidoreductase